MNNFCPRCGYPLNAGAIFCPKCGSRIVDAAPSPAQGPELSSIPKKKKKTPLIIILGAAVVLAAFLVVLFTVIIPNAKAAKRQVICSTTALDSETRFTFSQYGDQLMVSSKEDASDTWSEYYYNKKGELERIDSYTDNSLYSTTYYEGNLPVETQAPGLDLVRKHNKYDKHGRLTEVTFLDYESRNSVYDSFKWTYKYDKQGKIVEVQAVGSGIWEPYDERISFDESLTISFKYYDTGNGFICIYDPGMVSYEMKTAKNNYGIEIYTDLTEIYEDSLSFLEDNSDIDSEIFTNSYLYEVTGDEPISSDYYNLIIYRKENDGTLAMKVSEYSLLNEIGSRFPIEYYKNGNVKAYASLFSSITMIDKFNNAHNVIESAYYYPDDGLDAEPWLSITYKYMPFKDAKDMVRFNPYGY